MERRPLGIRLISAFYIFGAIALVFSSIFSIFPEDPTGIAVRHGLPATIEIPARFVVGILALFLAYGLDTLRKWGFWLTITYSLYFLTINLLQYNKTHISLFAGNATWAAFLLIYVFWKRRLFVY